MSAQPSRPLTPWLGVVAVGMIAANLRPGATSVGPALPDIREALDMSATVAGVLTGLPGLSFAVVGAGAVWLASRAGLNRALVIGLVAVAAGLLGRSFATSTPLFLVLSAVALGGAAVGNVLVPAFVKRHYPHRTASLMAVYTVSLAVGALLPGLIHPVGLCRSAGVPARDVYGIRLVPSAFGYKELSGNPANLARAQHCRAEVFLAKYGWVAMDPADVGKVMRLETPEWLKTTEHPVVAPVNRALFGGWEGNWLAFNTAHDVVLPGSKGPKLGFFMYPNAENAEGRFDSLEPDQFKYTITAREIDSGLR